MSQLVRDHVIEAVAGQARTTDAVLHDEVGLDDREDALAFVRVRAAGERTADGEHGAVLRLE